MSGKDYRGTDLVSIPSYDQIMMDSLEAFYQTEWKKAAIHFKSMKELDPADPRAYFFSSMIPLWEYFFVDQSEESARDFFMQSNEAILLGEEKLQKYPGNTIFQYVYAETLEKAGRTEEALIEYEKVIVMNNPELEQLHAMGVEKINQLK